MLMRRKHTVSAFDDDLAALHGMILEMGERTTSALTRAVRALRDHDLALAREVIADDRAIDALQTRAEAAAVATIALRAPMADDLRTLVASIKVSALIERTADYARNIARRVPLVTARYPDDLRAIAGAMHEKTGAMFADAIAAFADSDPTLAHAVRARDGEVDALYETLTRTLLEFMIEHPQQITDATHLLFIGKHLERIGDQATNIAEMVIYVATGSQAPARETGADRLAVQANPSPEGRGSIAQKSNCARAANTSTR